ncbi:hypothetical protein [Rheinheimera maricola]|uniref:Uncharacterized protein n=1 Tax=Rheinheimera maricola TaxID=2793282 RepID=A0ABS7XA88_9GAMM|nr:hypothetical protein [Rheinheimera maricola]MBZ9612473.1 hypothetical protein [Rheinheimera maricola]
MSVIGNYVNSVNQITADIGRQFSTSVESAAPAISSTLASTAVAKAATETQAESERDFVRVTSSIGKVASTGQLSRQEAVDIYRQIASFL